MKYPYRAVDVDVSMFPKVLKLLEANQWGQARKWCLDNRRLLEKEEFQADGIRVLAGKSWTVPFADSTPPPTSK